MKRKNINCIYNYAMLAIIVLLIPIIDFSNKFMVAIVGVIATTLVIDGIITLKNFIWFKQEEKYIKSFIKQINSFYDSLHIYFGSIAKNYPDNSYEIASAAYKLLYEFTDIHENEYEIFITMGSIKDLGRPHHWLTIFSRDDHYHEFPFIIDVNTIMHKADRNLLFQNVLEEYRAVILSVNDKEFKLYRPFTFMEILDDEHRTVRVNKYDVNVTSISEKDISSVDVKNIRNKISRKLKDNIIKLAYDTKDE